MPTIRLVAPAFLLLSFAPAFADDPATKQQAMTPPAELDTLKYFVGKWQCNGLQTPPAAISGKEFPTKEKLIYSFALDGFWLDLVGESEKTPGMPLPTVGRNQMHIGYDRLTTSFVAFSHNNRGGYALLSSKGWEGDKLMWSGSMSGLLKYDTRATITRTSAAEYRALFERMEGGKWMTSGTSTCKKK